MMSFCFYLFYISYRNERIENEFLRQKQELIQGRYQEIQEQIENIESSRERVAAETELLTRLGREGRDIKGPGAGAAGGDRVEAGEPGAAEVVQDDAFGRAFGELAAGAQGFVFGADVGIDVRQRGGDCGGGRSCRR